jgi:hypothetical protein
MRETVTTVLDITGLILLAAGLAGWLWQWIGPAALAAAGALIIVASLTAPLRTGGDK